MALITFINSVFIFITGICIGSFLNVVILRALSGESIVFPASKCPKCQTPLKWWHNIPIISYIFLKGKCAFCHEKISVQYPIIEFITGYLFLITYLKFDFTLNTLFLSLIFCLFIVISTIDIKEHIAFDIHSYILCAIGLIYSLFNIGNLYHGQTLIFNNSFIASILGILLGILIISIYFGIGYLFLKTMIIGIGDIYIAGAIGACFGWRYVWLIILLAFAIQIAIYIPIFFVKLVHKKDFLTLTLSITFGILTLIDIAYTRLFYLDTNFIYWSLVFVLAINGFWLCKRIIESLPKNLAELNEQLINETLSENKTENSKHPPELFHLPFGPALCCAALIVVFFIF
ncbi:MAG: prepilin peptidase [Candidatus Gastranaerophilaceae bacterium]